MELIPAIDIIDGKCVRLTQGDYHQKTTYSDNPVAIAQQFEAVGITRLHLVDLDGAKARRVVNLPVLKAITQATSLVIDFGGGVQSDADLERVLEAGAQQVTAGSIAVRERDTVVRWLERYGAERLILGADVRDRHIAIHGWQERSSLELMDFLEDYTALGLRYCICTDVSKDGLLQGTALELYRAIRERFPELQLIASGGIRHLQDLQALEQIGCYGAIMGKALYEGTLSTNDLQTFLSVC